MRHFQRLALGALSVGCLAMPNSGCTSEPARPPAKTATLAACSSDAVETCEAAISAALDDGRDVADAMAAYAAARADADPTVKEALGALAASKADAVVVRIGGAKIATKLPTIDLAKAPKPASISETVLWLALAEAQRIGFLVVARPDGSVARYFPKDPLRPMMGGLPAGVVDQKPGDVDADARLERALRTASDAARAFDYVKAADAIDEVDAALVGREPYDAVTLRGQIFSSALSFSKPAPPAKPDDKPAPPKPDGPPPTAAETPYYDLLRVRVDRHSIEWPRRKERLVAAFPVDRRDLVRSLYDATPGCGFAVPPPIEREGDLIFAYLLPRALLPSRAKAALGRVPLDAWYPRYASLLDTVERTGLGWYALGTLMLERGQASGMIPSGSEVHKHATELALKHARALKVLAEKRPARVGVGQVGFFLAPGNLLDEPLRKEVVDLTQIAARTSMSQAKEPSEVAIAALTGVLGGIQMPGEIREAHFTALQAAFTAKLRGEFAQKSGWGVALLFALDGAYRAAFDQAPNLKATADQIARALESDPNVEQPGLAALGAAITKYVSLGAEQGLGTAIPEGKDLLPARAAARASLEKAIAALGDGAPPPKDLAKDVADLADETIATVALALTSELKKPTAADAKKPAPKKADPKSTCSSSSTWSPDPRTRRSLDKLRDLRRKILANKAFAIADDAWTKRARLVVLLLSDAIDVASDWNQSTPRFAIGEADGERWVKSALDGWVPYPGVGDTLAGSFSAYRGLAGKGKDFFLSAAGATSLRKVLSGLGLFFGSDKDGMIEGAELLTLLAPKAGKAESELVPVLIDVAHDLYGRGKSKQADMLLLSTLVVTRLRKESPPEAAVKLAVDNHSQAAWALEFVREVSAGSRGEPMRVDAFVPDLKKAVADSCGVASVDELSSVLAAIDDFRAGKRKDARAKLEAFATEARDKAVTVPRFAFAFQQETRTRAMSLSIELGLGSGLLNGANSFSVGAGAKTAGEPLLKLGVTVDNPDAKRALDDTARYYLVASALAGVYDFLDGDLEAGEIAAARTLGAATQRTWLGVPGVTDDPLQWSADARGTIAILAQLAAESGRPLLAGDLLSLVKASLGSGADKESVKAILDPPPMGLVGQKDLAPVVDRTKATLDALFSQATCVHAKDVTATYEKAQCGQYPTALALRVADSVHVLPALSAGPKGQAGACPDLAALDGFLVPAQKQTYEPDKFLDAVTKLADAGKVYDATVLMTKHRRPDHCSAAVTDKLSQLADRMKGAPTTRADLLSALVNCTTGATPPEVAKSLGALDEELVRVGDPMRSAQLALFSAAITLKTDTIEPLAAIALRPDFLDRWRRQSPEIFGVALALDHAATILSGKPVRVDETARDFALLCSDDPAPDRAQLCKMVLGLRAKATSLDEKKKAAKAALEALANSH